MPLECIYLMEVVIICNTVIYAVPCMFKILYKEWLSNQTTDSMLKNGIFYLFIVRIQNGQQETGAFRCQPLVALGSAWAHLIGSVASGALCVLPCLSCVLQQAGGYAG